MHLAYPLQITREGFFAATSSDDQHIEQLIEQLLFTIPGERVNLPDFGTPLMQLVFSAGNAELVTATQFLIQGALQQWLGTLIQVQAVQISSEGETLTVTIAYVVRSSQRQQVSRFTSAESEETYA